MLLFSQLTAWSVVLWCDVNSGSQNKNKAYFLLDNNIHFTMAYIGGGGIGPWPPVLLIIAGSFVSR